MHQTSDLMRATRYSQLPMFKGYIPVDSISERRIFEPLIQGSIVD